MMHSIVVVQTSRMIKSAHSELEKPGTLNSNSQQRKDIKELLGVAADTLGEIVEDEYLKVDLVMAAKRIMAPKKKMNKGRKGGRWVERIMIEAFLWKTSFSCCLF